MYNVVFNGNPHKQFFYGMLMRCQKQDSYHQAFFYAAGLAEEIRANIGELFDFERDQVCLEGLYAGWQTSGTDRITRLAFNLWNGWVEEGNEYLTSPYELFAGFHAPYFWEAIRLRYPASCRRPEP